MQNEFSPAKCSTAEGLEPIQAPTPVPTSRDTLYRMNYSKTRKARPDYSTADLVCFSHLRWDFVFQRPQHLLTRFAKHRRVFFVEEPVQREELDQIHFQVSQPIAGLWRIVPHTSSQWDPRETERRLEAELQSYFLLQRIERYLFWFYTPMSIGFTESFHPLLTVYDCMDELANFKLAPEGLRARELQLFRNADLVFTGGHSLYRAKVKQHPRVFAMPSSVDTEHFRAARKCFEEPLDQERIPRPRIGYAGVIDERMDLELLSAVAALRPQWQWVLIGPVVKIDPASLPKAGNLHYLGMRSYQELPSYFAGWDAAILPFALNDATRFISPTKTPEYLAAGCPVVSTPIEDVVDPYFTSGLVQIGRNPQEFVWGLDQALKQRRDRQWLHDVDRMLARNSWDLTWEAMDHAMRDTFLQKQRSAVAGLV